MGEGYEEPQSTAGIRDMVTTLGLDIGDKTIGIAVSDDLNCTAQGVTTIYRKTLRDDLEAVLQIIQERKIGALVYGLPLNMDGTEGPQVRKVKAFIAALEPRLALLSVPCIPWDERMSTMAAERSLLEADLSRAKRRKVINKMAAVFILQGYIDSQSVPHEMGDDDVA